MDFSDGLLKRAPVGVVLLNKKMEIVEINDAALEVFGRSREEVLRKVCHSYICPSEVGRCPVLDLGQKVDRSEKEVLDRFGQKVPVLKTVSLIEKEGETFLLEVFMDISDQKRMERTLRASEERYRGLFESSRDAIVLTDQSGRAMEANPAALDLFGYSRGELLKLSFGDLYVDRRDAKRFSDEIERKRYVQDFETKLRKKDGSEMTCLLTVTVRVNEEGKMIGHQGMIRDITELKRVEEEREKVITDLQKALTQVKTLRGLLPICASCKKIRDDKGYWNRLETYLGTHTYADFSHGLCPECAKSLYPKLKL